MNQRKISAVYVGKDLPTLETRKDIWWYILEKNHLNVKFVVEHLQMSQTWEFIIRDIKLLHIHQKLSKVLILNIKWKDIKSLILAKNHMYVAAVARSSQDHQIVRSILIYVIFKEIPTQCLILVKLLRKNL